MLTPGAALARAPGIGLGQVVGGLGIVGVRDGELVGHGHGPGGRSRVGQRMEDVLVGRPAAGAVVVMEGQVGHV